MNVNFVFFLLLLFSFSSFIYIFCIYFLSVVVWDPKFMDPKPVDRPQLLPVLPHFLELLTSRIFSY